MKKRKTIVSTLDRNSDSLSQFFDSEAIEEQHQQKKMVNR